MAKARPNTLMWNVGFLLIALAVGVISYQFIAKREGFTFPWDTPSEEKQTGGSSATSASAVNKVKNGDGVLVVTMKNCPHCETMKGDLKKLSNSEDTAGHFAWADSKDESVSDLNVNSYPTILVFENGTSSNYTEGRSYSDLLALVKSTQSS